MKTINDEKKTITDPFQIADVQFKSRLILGTGKFASGQVLKDTLIAADIEMITVALRRVDLNNPEDHILSVLDPQKYVILPNTSGAQNAEEAVRLARIARASGISDWIKLEVTPDPHYLLPDGVETLTAAQILIKEGFKVMPYINADPILAKRLEEIGAVSVMPLGAPIGSNQGLKTIDQLQIIIEQAKVPVIIDAGIGKPSDAALALEIGADAVMINTAVSASPNPPAMAYAFSLAVNAGRQAYLAGLACISKQATASSVLEWVSKI